MENMWSIPNPYAADKINCSSMDFDSKLYFQDIECSMAHAAMLSGVGLIETEMSDKIIESLGAILDELDMGKTEMDPDAPSVRAFLDKLLDERVSGASALLNSFRHENERTSGALRLYLRDEWMDMRPTLAGIMNTLCRVSQGNMQARISQALIAGAMMLRRDTERLNSVCERMNNCPLGAYSADGQYSGTDRLMMCNSLGFSASLMNSLDALTDCDFCAEATAVLSILAGHLSRLASSLVCAAQRGEVSVSFEDFSALRRLLAKPESALPLALGENKTGSLTDLSDMSLSAEALITSCESLKNSLKIFAKAMSALSIAPEAEQIEISTISVERQIDYITAFIAKQNDGSGRY